MRLTPSLLMDRVRHGFAMLQARPAWTIVVCFAVAMAGVLEHQSLTQRGAARHAAMLEAAGRVTVLRELRALYTSEVVSRVRDHGVDVRHDYAENEGAIPLPATLSMLLAERISSEGTGVGLYSPYPFPWRQGTGGLSDDFARAAWDHVVKDPEQPFWRVEESANGPVLRYAVADRMVESCVGCHNEHPQTPKNDWVVGDVRGVLEARVPLEAMTATSLASSLPLVALLGVLGLACVRVSTRRARGEASRLEISIAARTAELQTTMKALEEQKYALDQSSIVSMTDVKGTITYVNHAFCEISGYSRAQLLGQNHRMIKSDEHPREFYQGMWRTIARGDVWRGEIKNTARDGSFYWVFATIVPFVNETGKPFQYVAIRVDITARKKLEMQLIQAHKLESIGQLAAGIAHEINTPTQFIGDNTRFLEESFAGLAPVLKKADELVEAVREGTGSSGLADELKAALEAADAEYLAEEIPRAIEQSLGGIARVRKIVLAMKEFSHPGEEGMTSIDLNHAIASTIIVATNEWKYVANLETDFDPELPAVHCLPGEINQVVLNLIVNAADAIGDVLSDGGGDMGTIRICTRLDGEFVEIRIADTGTGIPEKARGRVFDPFFTTKTVGKGSGQGLSIAYVVVVKKHGGTLDFETETGKGTTFIIRLPLLHAPAEPVRTQS